MNRPGIIRALAPHDVLSALMAEQAGLELVFAGGFGVSASLLGLPDLEFLSLDEMAGHVRRACSRLTIPLIADGDTGHGDLPQVQRTVREMERAGAAGVILEDQASPKRCGHFDGKRVIDSGEMALKIRAAVDARIDPNFVVVARTDARDVLGLDEAIRRANLYAEAGADLLFVESPGSVEELARIPREVGRPSMANMLEGGRTPILPAVELERMGYKIAVAPIQTALAAAKSALDLAAALLEEGTVQRCGPTLMPFEEIKRRLGVGAYLGLRERLATPTEEEGEPN